MANYQICRRYLTAFRTGQLRITCYWTRRKPRICEYRSGKTLLSRIFYEEMTRVWRGYPILSYWEYGNKTTYVGITMLNRLKKERRKKRKPARDCTFWRNVGEQTYLQRSASPYIVPKYAHFSNMPPHSGAVRRSTLQKGCSVYKAGVNYPTTWILLKSHRLEI